LLVGKQVGHPSTTLGRGRPGRGRGRTEAARRPRRARVGRHGATWTKATIIAGVGAELSFSGRLAPSMRCRRPSPVWVTRVNGPSVAELQQRFCSLACFRPLNSVMPRWIQHTDRIVQDIRSEK